MEQETWEYILDAFTMVNTIQGLVIAAIMALFTSRIGGVVVSAAFALIIDQFVTIAYSGFFDKSVGDIVGKMIEEATQLDAKVLIIRYVGFLIVITVFFLLKRIFVKEN